MTEQERIEKIRESAYFRYVERGFGHGRDLEDWLEAETEIESGMQQGGTMGPAGDEALKRIIRKHPGKEIPLVEGIEPEVAPFRE
ncbi:MAG: DUF2934 domain-containing protein [Burkholderiales bacterium]|nr:DUF2934 domain-containing protein [Burkholderiales bacterium]